MKLPKLSFLLTLLMSMVGVTTFAHDIAVKNADGKTIYYLWINNGRELSVCYYGSSSSEYDEYTGTVVIPASVTCNNNTYGYTYVGTFPVTSINYNAFAGCKGLTSVTIPNSVTSIGRSAFSGCTGLTNITIPNSVTSIDEYTFRGCTGLTSITIPNSVTSISEYAFQGCANLTNITVASDNTKYDSRNNCNAIIETASNTLIAGGKNTIIPNSVTSIGDNAFSGCTGLTSITIPNSVTSIGDNSFSSCTGLTSITIPNSVTSIGDNTFSGCTGLTSVTISNSVTSIGYEAFFYCIRLQTIYCLNPTPPNCSDHYPFILDTSNAKYAYDIYNYSILHVPMGSAELYSSALGWRYFKRIKEDMELDGNMYYANLTVKQGTTGFTRQAVKADEKYTIYIGSLGGYKVNAVTFNGVDVTDNVIQGYYTTPEIKGESMLSVSYEMEPSSNNSMTANNVKVKGYQDGILIENIDEASDVSVYTVDGKMVGNTPSVRGSVSLQVPSDQLYIVKVGKRTYKIAL